METVEEIEKDACPVTNTEIVFPHYTNHIGTIFGGKLVELMDMTGALSAMRFAGENVVTASIEALDFNIPVRNGDVVELEARVIYAGRSSMVVKIDVYRQRVFRDERQFCCRGYFVFVAIDAQGRPRRVPRLKVATEDERRWWEVGRSIKQRAAVRKRDANTEY